jgi:hypothetical protein
MLRLMNLEEFHRLLLRVPSIVDDLERGGADGPRLVRVWLDGVEAALESNRMPLAASIAALRSRLDAASGGAVPSGIELMGRPTKRKVTAATAAAVLEEATVTVSEQLRADEDRFEEADRIARQLTVAAQMKGIVGGRPKPPEWEPAVRAVWSAIAADPDLSAGAAHLLSLVGTHDAVVVMDRAITRDVWA